MPGDVLDEAGKDSGIEIMFGGRGKSVSVKGGGGHGDMKVGGGAGVVVRGGCGFVGVGVVSGVGRRRCLLKSSSSDGDFGCGSSSLGEPMAGWWRVAWSTFW